MDEQNAQDENLDVKIESYQIIMAENIFNHLGMSLELHVIQEALTNPQSKYFSLLKLPMLLSLNSLLLGQVDSYKLYCQKRLSDYVILTNPPNDVQSQADFQDKIPEDIVLRKQSLMDLQQKIRDMSQQHYDVLASMFAYLKNIVKTKVLPHPDIAWDKDEEFLTQLSEFEEKVKQLKLIFINIRQEAEDLAREITMILAQKNEFNLEPKDDEEEKMALKFYHHLGIEKKESKQG